MFGSDCWDTFRTAWETAVRVARIENFRFHDLRHTFASWLAQKGRPLPEIREALGHRTLAMTLRYAHLSPENRRAAVASLDGILSTPAAQDSSARAQVGHKNSKVGESVAVTV